MAPEDDISPALGNSNTSAMATEGILVSQVAPQVRSADVWIPAGIVSPGVFQGKFTSVPSMREGAKPVPLVVFLHGSSGLNENIKKFQQWLAEEVGVASIAPDSFALPERQTYQSPALIEVYEQVHALRTFEIGETLSAISSLRWVNTNRLLLAGTSEGAVSVARWQGRQFCARIIYSWSCEKNYFVAEPRNGFGDEDAVLHIISNNDPYFGQKNTWNDNFEVNGYYKPKSVDNKSTVVLLPDAPHTLFNLLPARWLAEFFIKMQLK